MQKSKHRNSNKPAADFFDNGYIPEPNSGCWLWERGASKAGYGLIQCENYYGYAHRYSYLKFKGAILKGRQVCHKCDMPPCVNPDHLWLGSPSDNTQDCLKKKRHVSDVKPEVQVRGERQGSSVLTEADVVEIRERYAAFEPDGKKNFYKSLAKEFGVSPSAINWIVIRRTWAHV